MFTFKMESKSRIPRSEKALEKAFLNCGKRGKFKEVERVLFGDYLSRAQRDLASAERDLEAGDFHWARVKAYQALFYMLNTLLIKRLGYFSKDHGCVIVALMKERIITEETAGKISLLVERAIEQTVERVYEDIDEYRIQRNFALYKPKSWDEVGRKDVEEELNKIKKNFKILVELL